MRIKSNNTFKVNRKRLLKNAMNIGLKFEGDKSLDRKTEVYGDGIKLVFVEPNQTLQAIRGYGDKESHRLGSNNTLTATLNDDILNLSLSSYGGICGFEFEKGDLFGKKIECYGDVYDCMLMMDVLKLLDGCVEDSSDDDYDDYYDYYKELE